MGGEADDHLLCQGELWGKRRKLQETMVIRLPVQQSDEDEDDHGDDAHDNDIRGGQVYLVGVV